MNVETANSFTISNRIDHVVVEEIEATFNGYRNRIANLSVEACGTLISMFMPLGPIGAHVTEPEITEVQVAAAPVTDTRIIDIEAIEWDQFAVELVRTGAGTREFVTA